MYLDVFGDYFQRKTTVTFGKPDVFTEKSFLAECGIGFSGGFEISKGISIDGEITFPFNETPYPTITTSLTWTSESEKFFIGFGNIIKTDQQGIGNLLFYTGINISKH